MTTLLTFKLTQKIKTFILCNHFKLELEFVIIKKVKYMKIVCYNMKAESLDFCSGEGSQLSAHVLYNDLGQKTKPGSLDNNEVN